MNNIKRDTKATIKQNTNFFKFNGVSMPRFNVMSKIKYCSPTLQKLTRF
ncbi:hypothetical protein SH2C18_32670 [Clostridium sediminicola]